MLTRPRRPLWPRGPREEHEAAPYVVTLGSAAELLDLKPEDALLASLRADLAQAVRRRRAAQGLTQAELAALLGSTQPKVSDLEHGLASLEQTVRALVVLGAERGDLAELLGPSAA